MLAGLTNIINDFYSTNGIYATGFLGILIALLIYYFIKVIKDIADWPYYKARDAFLEYVLNLFKKGKKLFFKELAKAVLNILNNADEEEKAKRGDKNAQYNLGCSYNEGDPSDECKIIAVMWFIIASANGSEEAKNELDFISDQLDEQNYKLLYDKAILKENEIRKTCPRIYSDFNFD